MAEGIAALRHLCARFARHGEEDPARRPAGNPERMGLGDAGEGAGEIPVVADRDGAIEGQHGQRRVVPGLVLAFLVLAAGRGLGVGGPRHPQRTRQKVGELAARDIARETQALAIGGADIVVARGRPCALLAVAEAHGGHPVVVDRRLIDPLRGAAGIEARHLLPEQVVGPQRQGGLAAARRRRADEGEGRLTEREGRVGDARIAAAQDLAHRLAMGRTGHIGVDHGGFAVIAMGEGCGEGEGRPVAILGHRAGGIGDEDDLLHLLVFFFRRDELDGGRRHAQQPVAPVAVQEAEPQLRAPRRCQTLAEIRRREVEPEAAGLLLRCCQQAQGIAFLDRHAAALRQRHRHIGLALAKPHARPLAAEGERTAGGDVRRQPAERERAAIERISQRRLGDGQRLRLAQHQVLAQAVAEDVQILVGVRLDARDLAGKPEIRARGKTDGLGLIELDIAGEARGMGRRLIGDQSDPAARRDLGIGRIEIDRRALDAEHAGYPGDARACAFDQRAQSGVARAHQPRIGRIVAEQAGALAEHIDRSAGARGLGMRGDIAQRPGPAEAACAGSPGPPSPRSAGGCPSARCRYRRAGPAPRSGSHRPAAARSPHRRARAGYRRNADARRKWSAPEWHSIRRAPRPPPRSRRSAAAPPAPERSAPWRRRESRRDLPPAPGCPEPPEG